VLLEQAPAQDEDDDTSQSYERERRSGAQSVEAAKIYFLFDKGSNL
jgi:hypothetical protein